ncbi:hypothetical protein [Rhodococcus sp. D-1]|uniref:hypothetical protein n=1 Tax=Rhodococcus sp. D-1 TaxID=1912238 RepID=UPI00117B151A|nr:hypothetical protein [Rhodococcus sp. D-1]
MSKKPGRKSQKRQPKPTSLRFDSGAARPAPGVHVLYDHLNPGVIAAFQSPHELGYDRLHQATRIIGEIIPDTITARLRLSGSMTASVDAILQERDTDYSAGYTTERGANVAVAKTIAAADGSFDIVMDASLFFDHNSDSEQQRRNQTKQVLHLAAHEPQHVLLHLSRRDSQFYMDDITCARTPRAYRAPLAEAIDEFRCELAANRIAPSAQTRESVFPEDLEHMQNAINSVRHLVGTDQMRTAFQTTMQAVCDLFKALAYLAAEYVAAEQLPEPPDPLPAAWNRYMRELWPDVFQLLQQVPAADEPCTHELLTATLGAVCVRFSQWMNEIGIRYENRAEGEECYWDHQIY